MSDVIASAPARALKEERSASPFPGSVAESLALVVAPSTGRFRPHTASGRLGQGALLGHVTGGRGRADEVRMPVEGDLEALLVRPGQLVRAGQGLVWLRREGTLPT